MGDEYIEINYAMSSTFCLYLKFSLIKRLKFYCVVLMVACFGEKDELEVRRATGRASEGC